MAPDGARPGSTAQVAALINAHVYLERFARTTMVTNLSPLLLAPVVETCLAIPTWLWCAGGKDRAPARMAATNLPPDITRRKSKGSPLQMHAQYFDTHREALKQFLCDGLLAENGIVDRTAVDRYCSLPPPVRDLDYLRLLELVDAEIWCRYQVDQRR
jgi:asparagine synthase (glutamine-hydrolysing)